MSTDNGMVRMNRAITASEVELSDSDRYRVLASETRREALDTMHELDAPVDLAGLSAAIAARRQAAGDEDDDLVETLSLELHHVHLPKLSDYGLVDYVPESHRVEAIRL